ncbi:hypothetical protein Holit_03124 [Hollandina sp. SP2]
MVVLTRKGGYGIPKGGGRSSKDRFRSVKFGFGNAKPKLSGTKGGMAGWIPTQEQDFGDLVEPWKAVLAEATGRNPSPVQTCSRQNTAGK